MAGSVTGGRSKAAKRKRDTMPKRNKEEFSRYKRRRGDDRSGCKSVS